MNTNVDVCLVEIFDEEKVQAVNNNLSTIDDTNQVSNLFKAISDPTRLRIVQSLLIEELCVCDISAIVNVSISAVSHQLRMLRNMRIVKNRREGKMVYYSLADSHINKLIDVAMEHIKE